MFLVIDRGDVKKIEGIPFSSSFIYHSAKEFIKDVIGIDNKAMVKTWVETNSHPELLLRNDNDKPMAIVKRI